MGLKHPRGLSPYRQHGVIPKVRPRSMYSPGELRALPYFPHKANLIHPLRIHPYLGP